MGIQALSAFARSIYSDGQNMRVRVSYRNSGSEVATFNITDDNSVVVQEAPLSQLGTLDVITSGYGCFLVQVSLFHLLRSVLPMLTSFFMYEK